MAEDVLRIGQQGFAGDQLVSLYRYYKRLTTSPGQVVQYSDDEVSMLQSIRLGMYINPVSRIFGPARTTLLRGQLATDTGLAPLTGSGASVLPPGAPLTVTGHSLGGHLALLFGRFFPEVTDHVYTYNAPGIGPQGEAMLRSLGITPIQPSRVTNVASVMGGEAISRLLVKPGETIGIATEPGSRLYEHSIVPLTDALSLYDAFGTLSPGLAGDATAVSGIISAASPFPENSLEVVLDDLRKVLDAGNAPTPIAVSLADLAERDAYYGNLYAVLDGRTPGHDYQIHSLAGKTAAQITLLAETEVSVRYALRELMPFYAKGADFASLEGVRFTGSWLSSRADMLEAELKNFAIDRPFGLTETSDSIRFLDVDSGASFALLDQNQCLTALPMASLPTDRQDLLAFLDGATYKRLVVFGSESAGDQLVGLPGSDRLYGGGGADRLDSGSGDDMLEGGAGDDVLIGGEGDDTLSGGEGSDRLEGGPGDDSYVLAPQLDTDTIADHDGRIYAGTTLLTGGSLEPDGTYVSDDGRYRYSFSGDLATGGTLLVNGALRMEGFRNEDLGIRLVERTAPEDWRPVTDVLLVGDPDQDYDYEFPDTSGNTHFVVGNGDDLIQDFHGGDDRLELGEGDDAGFGGAGNDLLEGGPGRDELAGGRGNDVLYANSADSIEADLDDEAVPVRADGGDLLSGGDGDDTLVGDAEANIFEGGPGKDRIFGGAGDDLISADSSLLAGREVHDGAYPFITSLPGQVDYLWQNSTPFGFSLRPGGGFASPSSATIGGSTLNVFVLDHAAGDADWIDAGSGNDTVGAGGGNDLVYGGAGDDFLDAGNGEDTIFGGDGRDYILASWDAFGDYLDGGGGNDMLIGGAGDDLLIGGDGDDRLSSFRGVDTLMGGEGNDFLGWTGDSGTVFEGGAGNDSISATSISGGEYVVRAGRETGIDMVEARRGTLVVEITGDVTPGEVTIERAEMPIFFQQLYGDEAGPLTGLSVSIGTGGDSVFIADILPAQLQSQRRIEFSDGTVWDEAYIQSLLAPDAPTQTTSLGDDTYLYSGGDGFAVVEDVEYSPGNIDVLRLAGDIQAGDVEVFAQADDYVLARGDAGVRIRGGRTQAGAMERIEFSDGTLWSPTDLEARAQPLPDNRAPLMAASMGSVSVDPGAHVEVSIPRDAISDPDRFDALSIYAITAEGERLPDWVSFDPAALKISASPGGGDTGRHELLLIAADSSGAATVSSLTIDVGGEVTAPPAGQPAPAQADSPATIATQLVSPAEVPAQPASSRAALAESTAAADVANLPPAVAARREEAESTAMPPLRLADAAPIVTVPADPVQRDLQRHLDQLMQTGRTDLGERYAEAIREFEERRRLREEPQEPPPTDEEIEAWNSAMHDWHDRNPGFAETEPGSSDGTWSMGWGLPGAGGQPLGANQSSESLDIARPAALPRLSGASAAPALGEGLRPLR